MKKKRLWIVAFALLAAFGTMVAGSLDGMESKIDTDEDGLPDAMEVGYGTGSDMKDTDGDGISDYWETAKYKTDPLKQDSDGDGIPDSDWEERREYTYSIRAVVDLRPPFNVEHMNDFYQDARIVAESLGDDVTRVEVILYPEAEMVINPSTYKPVKDKYTEPTYSKNYSLKMQKAVLGKAKSKKTDYEVVRSIMSGIQTPPLKLPLLPAYEYVELDKDLKCDSDLPVQFKLYKDEDGNIKERDFPKSSKYSREDILNKTFFANEMFFGKTVGACSSEAALRGAMMRAAGICEKTIFTIPLVYYFEGEAIDLKISDKYRHGFENVNGVLADHVFNEVLIGNQWVRIDNNGTKSVIDTGIGSKTPYVKILEYHDSADYNFTTYWNYDTWQEKRPYKYTSVIEQQAKYVSQQKY